ncbi:speckle targeted PIP5K1A-regulated poly(A) polymerase-like isoform X2 [Ornithodoros turicata]|uniref:speckle targeted PIP5K1A-regulated poly(A) polymerase-like isoform X2 n=1 Tax=Ornithodoros turicata TaxID=34597 RepID=UPI003139AA59
MSGKRKADISARIHSGKKVCRQHVSSFNSAGGAKERDVQRKGSQVHVTTRTSADFGAQSSASGQPSEEVCPLFPDISLTKSRHAGDGYFLRSLKPPVDELVDDETVLIKVQEHSNLHDQMHELCRMLLLTDEEVASRRAYCSALEAMLFVYFPGCTLRLFGSSDNGYGCKGCDMDLYLDFGRDDFYSEDEWKTAAKTYMRAQLPSVQKVASHTGEREKLGRLHPCLKLRFLVKLFRYHLRPVLSSCCYIPARCPIVRFIDRRGNRQCDINATSRASLVNTSLLKTFNQCDSRVRPLLLAARTWFRAHGLLDSTKCFSAYAVSLLVCFYLQSVDPPVLPTLEQLAELHSRAGGKPEFADGYRCDFAQDRSLLPSSDNTADLGKLLEGFFEFLFGFNYRDDAMIVQSATIMPRSTLYAMLDGTNSFFFESPVAMQDPFILHNNVTRLVKPQAVDVLIQKAEAALQACRDGKDLVWLLSQQPVPQIRKTDISTKEVDEYALILSSSNSGRFKYDSEEWLNEVC